MTETGIRLAAQLLRQYVAAAHSADQQPDVPAIVNKVYPAGFDQSVDATELLRGNLMLGSLLISMMSKATGRSPLAILDSIIAHEAAPPEPSS